LTFICKPGAVAAVVGVEGGGVVVTIVNVADDDAGVDVVDGGSVDTIKYPCGIIIIGCVINTAKILSKS